MTKMNYFDFKLGFSCNNNCIHCVITDKKQTKDLTYQEVIQIIDTRKEEWIGFTGGEPTLRKDFLDIIKYTKSKGFKVALQTNGVLLGSFSFAQEAAPYLDSVLIALHSCKEDVHNAIVRNTSSFQQSWDALKNLQKLNVPTVTQTVISKLNVDHLVNTYDAIQAIYPGVIMNMTFPHPNGNAYTNRWLVVPQYYQIKPYINEALAKYAPLISVEAIPDCWLYPYHDKIHASYDRNLLSDPGRSGIDPANKDALYFNEEGIIDCYEESMLSERRKGLLCSQCIFNDTCAGVWKEYVEFFGNHFDLFPIKKEDKEVFNDEWGSMIIYGNSKCMNTCTFCSGVSPEISDQERLSKALSEADYFLEKGIRNIELSGGDPAEFKLLPQVVEYLKKGGVQQILVATHGRTLRDKNFLAKLKEAGMTSVKVPLYGSAESIHNKMTQHINPIGNAFRDTVAGLKNCEELGVKVVGYSITSHYNKENLLDIYKLYDELLPTCLERYYLGVAFIAEKNLHYTGDWFIPLSEASPYIQYFIRHIDELKRPFTMLDVPYCVSGKKYPFMENEKQKFPNLGTHGVDGGHDSKELPGVPHYRIKTQFPLCRDCKYRDECGGIPRNEWEMFGRELCLDLPI